jgi:hypothetical protein
MEEGPGAKTRLRCQPQSVLQSLLKQALKEEHSTHLNFREEQASQHSLLPVPHPAMEAKEPILTTAFRRVQAVTAALPPMLENLRKAGLGLMGPHQATVMIRPQLRNLKMPLQAPAVLLVLLRQPQARCPVMAGHYLPLALPQLPATMVIRRPMAQTLLPMARTATSPAKKRPLKPLHPMKATPNL